MQLSQVPSKVPLAFASSGTKNTIPTASQIGITAGAASLTDGFPPLTFTPLSAGGVPPSGADFNGILNLITSIQRWQSAGGFFPYDSAFATSVSGYPKGAVLLKASGAGYWICTSDNNTANPDTGGSGWMGFDPTTIQSGVYSIAADTGTANTYAITLSPAPAALTPGMTVGIDAILVGNNGAATLNVNGLGALPIQSAGGVALQGGELVGAYGAVLRLNHAGTAWVLLQTTGGSLPVKPGTQSEHAVNLGQFLGPITTGSQIGTLTTSATYTKTISFTAPSAGFVWGQGRLILSNVSASMITLNLIINGTTYGDQTTLPMTDAGVIQVTSGQAITVTAQAITGSVAPGASASLYADAIFIPSLTN